MAAAVLLAGLPACGGDDDDGEAQTARGGSSTTAGASEPVDPIRIGVVTSLTGPGSTLGVPHKQALELRVEQLNEEHGVDIEITIVDDESQPERALEQVRTLLTGEGVDAIIGPTLTATCYATKPLTEQAGVLQYCLSSAPIPYPAPFYFTAFPPSARNLGDLPAYWMKQEGYERVACLATDDASGQLYEAAVSTGMEGLGLEFLGTERYGATDTDATAQLTRIQSRDPDIIYSCTTGRSVAVALQSARQLGLDVPWWVPVLNPKTADLVKDLAPPGGLFGGGYKIDVYEQLPDDDRNKEKIAAFAEEFEARYNDRPDAFAAAAVDALDILVGAFLATGSRDPGEIVQHLEAEVEHVGVQTNYDFTGDDHQGTEQPAIVIRLADDGSVELLERYDPDEIPTNARPPGG